MSVIYCPDCQRYADTDYDVEHDVINEFGVRECQVDEIVDTKTEYGEVCITIDGLIKMKGTNEVESPTSTRVL